MLGNKLAIVGRTTLDKSLRLVDEGVWQRIGADIANRERLSLLFQDEFHAAGQVLDGTGFNSSGQAHAVIARRALQCLILRDGVVVGLALTVTKPSQEGQGDDDNANTDAEFSTSLHRAPLRECSSSPIVAYPEARRYGTSVGGMVTGHSDLRHTSKYYRVMELEIAKALRRDWSANSAEDSLGRNTSGEGGSTEQPRWASRNL